MLWTSIPHAHEHWRLNNRQAERLSDLENIEHFILAAPPKTSQDAVCILDVVCANRGDVRTDNLDYDALERVRSFLLSG